MAHIYKQAENGLQSIFRKWQDSSVALWIEIAVILNWRQRLKILNGLVWFCWYTLAWMTGIDDWHGGLAWMIGMDDWHGGMEWMTGIDDLHG